MAQQGVIEIFSRSQINGPEDQRLAPTYVKAMQWYSIISAFCSFGNMIGTADIQMSEDLVLPMMAVSGCQRVYRLLWNLNSRQSRHPSHDLHPLTERSFQSYNLSSEF